MEGPILFDAEKNLLYNDKKFAREKENDK